MGKLLNIILIGSFLLISCTSQNTKNNSDNMYLYKSPAGYSVKTPKGFTFSELAPSGKYYYFGYPNNSKTNLHTIELYDRDILSCSPSITGASQTTLLKETNGTWGRADWWDGYGKEGWEWPANWENILCTYEGTPAPTSVYAFCSEKNGKTVVICISQMTDNPQQAEEIFKTFRWSD